MYCSLEDLKQQFPEDKILELADDEGQGEFTDDVLAKIDFAIKQAGQEIDAYVAVKYPVPLEPVPDILNKIAIDIASYNLFTRRGIEEDEKAILNRYKNAVYLLKMIAEGKLELSAGEKAQNIVYKTRKKAFGYEFERQY